MDYRHNNNNNQRRVIDEPSEVMNDPYSFDNKHQSGFDSSSNRFDQQQPLGGLSQPSTEFGSRRQDYMTKNYNDFLERQGIPALSHEDMAILRECGRESLFYRCLPITAALCAGLVYMSRLRQVQPRFYHYLGAVFAGYFIGKISYRSKCENKLINSKSNSPFVNAIRKRKGLFVEEYGSGDMSDGSMESDWTMPSSSTMNKSYGIQEFDDESPMNKRTTNPSPFYRGVDDNVHSNEDAHLDTNITYDDLRNRNRSSFKNI